MANKPEDSFKKRIQRLERLLERDVLADCDPVRYPDRIDWLAGEVAKSGSYPIGLGTSDQRMLDAQNFGEAITTSYLDGIRALTGNTHYLNSLPDDFPLGQVVLEYADLADGLVHVNRRDVNPGEVLGRLIIRSLQRRKRDDDAQLVGSLNATTSPRELVEQLCAYPELADDVLSVVPSSDDPKSLPDRLAAVELGTPLWSHQRTALRKWLEADANGFVNMATATGKTVLGLAAVGFLTPSGSLHPEDEASLEDAFDGDVPRPARERSRDVLIVTTDELLGVQWSRLFEQHCNTPPEYTTIEDGSIRLPWGTIDIRAAEALSDVDPSDYRLAIFDEVHNYSSGSGWGDHLVRFVDSTCPVLALTGSVTRPLRRRIERADRPFPEVFTYTHKQALEDGIIPDFEWTLRYVTVDEDNSSTLAELRTTAELFSEQVTYEGGTLRLTEDVLSNLADDAGLESDELDALADRFETPTALATALIRAGSGGKAPTDRLDRLASGLSNRRTHWWNLRPSLDVVEEIVAEAMNDERPCLVLTRSYEEARAIWKDLRAAGIQADRMVTLGGGDDADGHDSEIQSFDNEESSRKVLIGPGDRIGTGVDIKTVEVGINLARPGTGVNASLIQRLGRLLRKSSGKNDVEFHHVLALPPEPALAPIDGGRFLRNACGFVSQVKEPDTDGVMKLPAVRVQEGARDSVLALERSGARTLKEGDGLNQFEQSYVDAVLTAENDGRPVIETAWYEEQFSHDGKVDDEKTDQGNRPTTRSTADGGVSDEPSSEGRTPATVEVDAALVELIDHAVEGDDSWDSRSELTHDALEAFLGTFLGRDVESMYPSRPVPDPRITVECDPTLAKLLESKAESANADDVSAFVQALLLDVLGVDGPTAQLDVPNFDRYEFVVERLIDEESCPYETAAEVVQAALERHFGIDESPSS